MEQLINGGLQPDLSPRSDSLRILIVEDSTADLQLLTRTLEAAGYVVEYQQVQTAAAMRRALLQHPWDFVVSDHSLPEFDALGALELTREYQPAAPFIIVSGDIDEAMAIDAMRRGSCDYVFKDRLERLVVVIERELRSSRGNTHDVLTGLLNRYGFRQVLEKHVGGREHEAEIALVMLDVDRFRTINQGLGYAHADELLQQIAMRLRRHLPQALVARLNGDEFAVLLSGVSDTDVAESGMRRCFGLFREPFVIGGQPLRITASLGCSVLRRDARGLCDLITNAERAMYHAKNRGGDAHCMFRPEMANSALEAIRIENDLHDALRRGELHIEYQPQVNVGSRAVIGVEALLRWTHPVLGELNPAQFIPVAESSGLIVEIGRWVLRQTCVHAARWHRSDLGPVRVAVNLSARQFREGDLVQEVMDALQDSGLAPSLLELEITEGTLMENTLHSKHVLEALRGLGVQIAIDDFGTGYSSLGYLKRFPLDALKIDRSFVMGLSEDDDHDTLVEAIVGLAHNLGLRTVAEGVEHESQFARLRQLGCREAQGYLLGRPMASEAIESLLRADRTRLRPGSPAGASRARAAAPGTARPWPGRH